MGVYSEFSQTHDRTIANVLRGLEEDTPVSTDLTEEEIEDLAKPPKAKKPKADEPSEAVVDVDEASDAGDAGGEVSEDWVEAGEPSGSDAAENYDTMSENRKPAAKKLPTKPAIDLIDNAYRNLGFMMKAIDDLQDLIPVGFRYGAATNAKNELSRILKEWKTDAEAGKGGE